MYRIDLETVQYAINAAEIMARDYHEPTAVVVYDGELATIFTSSPTGHEIVEQHGALAEFTPGEPANEYRVCHAVEPVAEPGDEDDDVIEVWQVLDGREYLQGVICERTWSPV